MMNFVSNLPSDLRTGGFSAMNVAACSALRSRFDVHYVGPVNPGVNKVRKAVSKMIRLAGLQGDYAFFSQSRLHAIADEVAAGCTPSAQLDFFHGFTPWILTKPSRPYVAWSDCTFRDYIEFFHRRGDFRRSDLARIEALEADWLKAAAAVIFTSEWAAARARVDYSLDPNQVSVVGILGDFAPPDRDAYEGALRFAFISTNFVAKGGFVVLEAFRHIRPQYPGLELVVVGDRNPRETQEPGVSYLGYLRKEDAAEYKKLRQIFSTSRAIVNATRSDIAPVLLVEAGYFGCPAISSKRFAIPEIIDDEVTGFLIDNPEDPQAIAQAMRRMLEDEVAYKAMRQASWEKSRRDHSRESFQRRLCSCVDRVL